MSRARFVGSVLVALTVLVVLAPSASAQEGEKERGWLGIRVRDLGEGEAAELGFDRDRGVLIQHVVEGSPAAKVGLREGDVLVFVRKVKIATVAELMEAMAGASAGEKTGFAAWRPDGIFDGQIVLGTMPEEFSEDREVTEFQRRVEETVAALERARHEHEETMAAIEAATDRLVKAGEEGHGDRVRDLVGALRELSAQAARRQVRVRDLEQEFETLEREARERRAGPREEREPDRADENTLEIMHLAVRVLLEAERKDSAELVERKMRAIKMDLEGRRDEESVKIREAAPSDGAMAELLHHAGKLYREFEKPDRAEWCEKLGRHYLELHRAGREKDEGEEGTEARMRRLEDRLAELRKVLADIARELEELRRERR